MNRQRDLKLNHQHRHRQEAQEDGKQPATFVRGRRHVGVTGYCASDDLRRTVTLIVPS